MTTLKTSISVLALFAGLSLGFAPNASFAQDAPNAGAVDGVQKMVDHMNKIQEAKEKLKSPQQKQADAKAAKDKAEPAAPKQAEKPAEKAPGKSASNGGKSGDQPKTGFVEPQTPPQPAEPKWYEKCWNKVCEGFNKLIGNEDEAKSYQEHKDAVKKASEEMKKAAATEADKPKTTEAPKTEPKTAPKTETKSDVKGADTTPKTVAPQTPSKTVETNPVLPEAPKTNTTQSRINPVVIPARTQPALIPAATTAPTVTAVRAPSAVATPAVATAVRPATTPVAAAAVVSTTVGRVQISGGAPIATPRVPTPSIPMVAVRR